MATRLKKKRALSWEISEIRHNCNIHIKAMATRLKKKRALSLEISEIRHNCHIHIKADSLLTTLQYRDGHRK
ncbi:hypothetical protein DICVIV_01811 [Dictyocaulus viviparus]|uniref:Uncharacterized protein n=1 Tax=Dictyocaulus viviparus TaxID=29172 RepID=A0A0D8Y5I8_DICVI|nr:hypothetical protein DICVIV_01811 [Dictyocaulus viviparus]